MSALSMLFLRFFTAVCRRSSAAHQLVKGGRATRARLSPEVARRRALTLEARQGTGHERVGRVEEAGGTANGDISSVSVLDTRGAFLRPDNPASPATPHGRVTPETRRPGDAEPRTRHPALCPPHQKRHRETRATRRPGTRQCGIWQCGTQHPGGLQGISSNLTHCSSRRFCSDSLQDGRPRLRGWVRQGRIRGPELLDRASFAGQGLGCLDAAPRVGSVRRSLPQRVPGGRSEGSSRGESLQPGSRCRAGCDSSPEGHRQLSETRQGWG